MLKTNVSLQPYNTFGLEAKAEYFAEFGSVEELQTLLKEVDSKRLFILGGGSNILLTQDVKGVVLRNNLRGIEVVHETEDDVHVRAQGGEVWHDFVMYAIANDFGGIENLSLIPGSVGAAPMQNIGAYGREIKDVFVSLEAMEIASGEIKTFKHSDCQFGYRESVFKRNLKGQYIITSMTLKLSKTHELNTSYGAIQSRLAEMGVNSPTIKDVSDAVIYIRQTKLPDPAKIGNSGSFFKNPVIPKAQFEALKIKFPEIANYPIDDQHVKLAAGWLIDNAGWKGKTMGNYGVHKNQALVLVNYGGAQGQEIYDLSEEILQAVQEMYGVTLEREVNII